MKSLITVGSTGRRLGCLVLAAMALVSSSAGSARGDVVTEWNENFQDAVRNVGGTAANGARLGAIVHSAMFDAHNGIEKRYTPIHVDFDFAGGAAPGSSRRAAVIQAAYATLVAVFPSQKATFDAERAASLASIVGDPADVESSKSIANGIEWGAKVAADILAWRSGDGWSPEPDPFFGNLAVGQWRSTPPAYAPGAGPQLGNVTPWVLPYGSYFRPAGPPSVLSAQYTTDFKEVKALGSLENPDGARTADQTEAARFWQSPDQRWDRIAHAIVAQRGGQSLSKNVRLFAMLHLAQADATLACWDAKYFYNYWRPITAINLADTDGNPDTDADVDWKPLITTPPFPEYPSGHAAVAPAQALVIYSLLGDTSFSVTSSPSATAPAITRSFNSLGAAVDEAFYARIWGGIHFFTACQAGRELGIKVGNYVLANAMLPLKARPLKAKPPRHGHNHGAGTVNGEKDAGGYGF